MSDQMSDDALQALKIAFTYMPNAIEVNRYEHGDEYERILSDIQTVREILLLNGVDPDEIQGELRPESTPSSSY